MQCVGCDKEMMAEDAPAMAVMHLQDLAAIDRQPVTASGLFGTAPICDVCYAMPDKRLRTVKAHFYRPSDAVVAVAAAGESGSVG